MLGSYYPGWLLRSSTTFKGNTRLDVRASNLGREPWPEIGCVRNRKKRLVFLHWLLVWEAITQTTCCETLLFLQTCHPWIFTACIGQSRTYSNLGIGFHVRG